MMVHFRICVSVALLLGLAACATQGQPPPVISLDDPVAVAAQRLPEPAKSIEVVAVPEPLPLPEQMKVLPVEFEVKPVPEPADDKVRVSRANEEARMAPTREGYVNAIQVWPYADGALYQVYASAGTRDRRIAPAGRGTGDRRGRGHRALDRGRYVQRCRGRAARQRAGEADRIGPQDQSGRHHEPAHIPARADLDGKSVDGIGVLGLPEGSNVGLAAQAQAAQAAAPVDTGLSLEKIRFRYAVTGNPPWKPLRAFDDGREGLYPVPGRHRAG
jgi:hypothetical protein